MIYRDSRGWTYEVRDGLRNTETGHTPYKAWSSRPGSGKHKFVNSLPWRDTREQAEADLQAWAEKKRMELVDE